MASFDKNAAAPSDKEVPPPSAQGWDGHNSHSMTKRNHLRGEALAKVAKVGWRCVLKSDDYMRGGGPMRGDIGQFLKHPKGEVSEFATIKWPFDKGCIDVKWSHVQAINETPMSVSAPIRAVENGSVRVWDGGRERGAGVARPCIGVVVSLFLLLLLASQDALLRERLHSCQR